jgi:putative transposase
MKNGGVPWGLLNPPNRPHGQEYATVMEATTESFALPAESPRDVLTQVLHEGAHRMLIDAIEAEVQEHLAARAHLTDGAGRRLVVRNGYLPERELQTPIGSMPVKQPRVRDKRPADGGREKFTSRVLPPYLRRTRSIEELIPWLYLKGISTNDFAEALAALLGPDAAGLSASTVTRLKSGWEADLRAWSQRSLEGKHYVYVWADGVHFNVRLEDAGADRQCILVLIGATAEGKKELIAITDGYRESKQSWKELLLDVRSRGLTLAPKLAIGDGALGFWAAVREVWPTIDEQRCWVHKTANVLNKLPKGVQGKAKSMLHDIWMADTRAEACRAFDLFLDTFGAKHPAACECLAKDRDVLLTFYNYPAEHWVHIRTTNPIESTFATVRLRTDKTKGSGSRIACLTMVFKLVESAQKRWRALNGSTLIPDVITGVKFVDGVKDQAA